MNTEKPSILVPNWKLVMKKSWSIWLILIAAALSAMEASLATMPDMVPGILEMPHGVYAMLSVAISSMAWIARLLVQQELHPEEKDPVE